MRHYVAASITACAILTLASVSCSRPKVEVVEKTTYAEYLRWREDAFGGRTWYWLEKCTGDVTNTGNKVAFKVRARVQFSRGASRSALIDCVNLEPAEVGSFYVTGDTIKGYTGHDYSKPKDPSVSASVSVTWE